MDPAVKKLLESKDKKISDLQNAYKRALADTENIRERTRKEIQKSTQFAIQKFAKDLLDISDILKMALESVPEEKREDKSDNILYSLFTGVSMTRTQLLNTFKKHGLEMFNPLGEVFDANKHQAMFQTPMADKEPGIVIAVQKEGYILNGRILRPAQVGVSKKPDDSEKK
ncbi:GrpE nucleotide exchange factor [Neocallimastix sp. 'constans']